MVLVEHPCWSKLFIVIMPLYAPLPLDRGKGEPEDVVQALAVGDDCDVKCFVCRALAGLNVMTALNRIIIPYSRMGLHRTSKWSWNCWNTFQLINKFLGQTPCSHARASVLPTFVVTILCISSRSRHASSCSTLGQ
jgi:hypothetical protein